MLWHWHECSACTLSYICARAHVLKRKGHGSLQCVCVCVSPPFPHQYILSVPSHIRVEKQEYEMKGQKWKLITWADLASFWLYSLSICFSLLLVCKEKKGEESVRKRYADGQVEGHKERQGSEIQSSVRKCTETHYPPNLTILSHTHTLLCWPLPLGSVSLLSTPAAPWLRATPSAHVCQQVAMGTVHSGHHSPLIPCQQFIT